MADTAHADIKKLSSAQLKIDAKSAVVQQADGAVYFSGGFDEGRGRSHGALYAYDPLQGSMSQQAVANPNAFERANYLKVLSSYIL